MREVHYRRRRRPKLVLYIPVMTRLSRRTCTNQLRALSALAVLRVIASSSSSHGALSGLVYHHAEDLTEPSADPVPLETSGVTTGPGPSVPSSWLMFNVSVLMASSTYRTMPRPDITNISESIKGGKPWLNESLQKHPRIICSIALRVDNDHE
ncbi:unnamed protein product [Pleuronectes platessa]|uniref:Uncharacterized protein n=1 Tax=Pleuronectes platessa TaxID=8262 RepID=A0A9N7YAG7_PLEPL|nr:unnamed protein product [Pleuronectes platessa]